jgi:hypothetical protein
MMIDNRHRSESFLAIGVSSSRTWAAVEILDLVGENGTGDVPPLASGGLERVAPHLARDRTRDGESRPRVVDARRENQSRPTSTLLMSGLVGFVPGAARSGSFLGAPLELFRLGRERRIWQTLPHESVRGLVLATIGATVGATAVGGRRRQNEPIADVS